MKNQAKMVQTKEESKFQETDPNKMKLCHLPDRKFQVTGIKRLNEVRII